MAESLVNGDRPSAANPRDLTAVDVDDLAG
jgi:hypothetical protein